MKWADVHLIWMNRAQNVDWRCRQKKKIRYLCNKCEYWLPRQLAKKRESRIRRIFTWKFGPISYPFKKPHELIHFKFTNIPFIWSLFCLHVQFILNLFVFSEFIASPLNYCTQNYIEFIIWTGYFIAYQFETLKLFSLFMGTREKKNHFDFFRSIFLWLARKELRSFKCRRLLFHKQDRISKTKMHIHKKDPQTHKIILRKSSANLRSCAENM